MLGPLAGDSPGNRELGRLGTCSVRKIGRLEGPGSGRRSGLPPRTPFFSAKSKTNGIRKCSGPQKLLRPDPFGTLGPKLGGRAPFSALFKVQRRFPRNLLCNGRSPPGTFGVFYDRPTRRVPRPLSRGDADVGKSGDPAKGQRGER